MGAVMIQIIKGRVKGDWPLITRSRDYEAERFKKEEQQAIYEAKQKRERKRERARLWYRGEQKGELDGTG